MLDWIWTWWRDRQRASDLKLLWPSFKEHARDLEHARIGFIRHMSIDPAWSGMTEEELVDFVRTKLI